MVITINKIISLLTRKEKQGLIWLSLAMVAMALIEVAGIASIMPFMAVVGNPNVIEENHWIHWVYQQFGFTSVENFLLFLGFFVLFVIVASNIFKAGTTWFELKFINFRTCSLSRRLFFHYLTQPYEFFLDQNTSILGKNLLQEVFQFINSVLKPATEIFSKLVIALFIFGLLLLVDPLLAFMVVATLGVAYAFLFHLVKRKLEWLGEERFQANAQRFKMTSEAFGGIKDLKILGRESVYFEKFSFYARKMAENITAHQIISQMPRFVMEILSFGGILVIVLYFLMIKGDLGQTLPILALYAFAGYRLMPALQGIFSAVTTVRFNLAVLNSLHQEFAEMQNVPRLWHQVEVTALPYMNKILLEGISYTYPGAESPVISDLNLTINKNSSIGFVGATGSGKTTTVDILLGLLTPKTGSLRVDDVIVTPENLPRWQRTLGYVPQSIFLCDDSVASNIAFSVPLELIDMVAVERAAKIANLHDFVVGELPQGYSTPVGERGVRLSGGQRQRIGIARALYHDPDILLMDEATSALDGITEEAVIQAIRNLAGYKTIITIAHRLTTLKDCDVIYVMDQGQILEQGTYAELVRTSSRFLAMSRADSNGVYSSKMGS